MANNGEAPQGTVKDRVLKCEVSLKAAEETIRKQGEVIAKLREENLRLDKELKTFKGQIQSKVKGHVEKIKEDLQFKHAFIVVQNKQLQNQVIAQKAQKAALVTQIEGLDHRMAALEDAVGTDWSRRSALNATADLNLEETTLCRGELFTKNSRNVLA